MNVIGAIVLEAFFTLFLVSAVFGTCVSPQAQRVGGFAIGLVVLACALGGGGALTGAVMTDRTVAQAVAMFDPVDEAEFPDPAFELPNTKARKDADP